MDTLRVHTNRVQPGMIEVVLDGRLDTQTAPMLEQQLDAILLERVEAMRFDMSRLDYISSLGLTLMLRTFKTLNERKTVLLVMNLQPQVKKVFDIARMLPRESIFTSVQEADAYFDAMQKKALNNSAE